MDRNTVIGFVLLALLFFGYFYYTRQGQLATEKEKHTQDSLNNLKVKKDSPVAIVTPKDTVKANSSFRDSIKTEQL